MEKLLALDIARAASAPMRQVESGRTHTLPKRKSQSQFDFFKEQKKTNTEVAMKWPDF